MVEFYQFRCHFAESQEMVCYLKREAYSVPIYYEVQQNDICLEHFKLIGELIPDLTRSQCN